MQIELKPWVGNERLYFYPQSQQLSGQTGQIGRLRADFDRDGNGFYSTWEDIRGYLKTDDNNSKRTEKESGDARHKRYVANAAICFAYHLGRDVAARN